MKKTHPDIFFSSPEPTHLMFPPSPPRRLPREGLEHVNDPPSPSPPPLIQYDPVDREGLGRVNDAVDPLDGEQTWPSEQELLDVEKLVKGRERKRRLPAGVGCEGWLVCLTCLFFEGKGRGGSTSRLKSYS